MAIHKFMFLHVIALFCPLRFFCSLHSRSISSIFFFLSLFCRISFDCDPQKFSWTDKLQLRWLEWSFLTNIASFGCLILKLPLIYHLSCARPWLYRKSNDISKYGRLMNLKRIQNDCLWHGIESASEDLHCIFGEDWRAFCIRWLILIA